MNRTQLIAKQRNTALTKHLLYVVLKDVRKHRPEIKQRDAGLTWSTYSGRRFYFFELDDFRWEGIAYSATEARYKAWCALLKAGNVEGCVS